MGLIRWVDYFYNLLFRIVRPVLKLKGGFAVELLDSFDRVIKFSKVEDRSIQNKCIKGSN